MIKPNWVFHENQRGAGLECLVTHSSIVEGVAKYVGLTNPAQLVIGDAPVQGCDFAELRNRAGIDGLEDRLRRHGLQFSITDFRRTILAGNSLERQRSEGVRGLENFVLFDLKQDSLLDALAEDASKFRVTMYNPELLHRTHGAGRHQYLIAKEVIEANVLINLPKLKSHRKACVTGTLKNLVGINGNKEYLPHHRKGGSESGGDCYVGRPGWKRVARRLAGRCESPPSRHAASGIRLDGWNRRENRGQVRGGRESRGIVVWERYHLADLSGPAENPALWEARRFPCRVSATDGHLNHGCDYRRRRRRPLGQYARAQWFCHWCIECCSSGMDSRALDGLRPEEDTINSRGVRRLRVPLN